MKNKENKQKSKNYNYLRFGIMVRFSSSLEDKEPGRKNNKLLDFEYEY